MTLIGSIIRLYLDLCSIIIYMPRVVPDTDFDSESTCTPRIGLPETMTACDPAVLHDFSKDKTSDIVSVHFRSSSTYFEKKKYN